MKKNYVVPLGYVPSCCCNTFLVGEIGFRDVFICPKCGNVYDSKIDGGCLTAPQTSSLFTKLRIEFPIIELVLGCGTDKAFLLHTRNRKLIDLLIGVEESEEELSIID